jgi:hypothetical protein
LYSHGLSARTGTGAIGINPDGEAVLARRQVAIVIIALGKASHIFAVNGYDKAEIGSEVCDPVNEDVT